MTHEQDPSEKGAPYEPQYPDKSIWDIDPDVAHNPDLSALENIYAAYHDNPPQQAVDFAIYLDTIDGLLERLHAGEIDGDEFLRLQEEAGRTIVGDDN